MIGVTVLVTAVGIILALMSRPGRAVGILIASMMVWPEYLRIPIGLAEMSAPRLIALALLIKLVVIGRHRRISICSVDWLIFLVWAWTVVASILGNAPFHQLTTMIGQVFDTVLMYFVARMAIRTADDLKQMIGPLFFVAVYMCIMGWMEAITFHSPYIGLDKYRGWVWIEKDVAARLGLMRAKVSTSVHIFFGMAMMLISAIAWSMHGDPRIKKICTVTAFAAAVATLSSMSSGPWLAVIILIVCNAYVLKPKLIKPTLYILLALCIFLELASNRHFYNLIDYVALNSETAWYRSRLLEVAAAQWRDYWLVGTGDKSIQYWGALLDGRKHIDLVNHFIILATNGGLAAMIMYIAAHINAIRYGVKAYKRSQENVRRLLIFGLISGLIALDISSMSVGLFGPPLILSNILMGILISASVAWRESPVPNRKVRKRYTERNLSAPKAPNISKMP